LAENKTWLFSVLSVIFFQILDTLRSYMKWLNFKSKHVYLIFLLITEHWHALVIIRNAQLWNSLLSSFLITFGFCWYTNKCVASDIKYDVWKCF
jgi:hypothetical protein